MQTAVTDKMQSVTDGLVDSNLFNQSVKSFAANETIPFGKAVVLHDTTDLSFDGQLIDLPATAAEVDSIIGISIRDCTKEPVSGQTYAAYEQYDAAGILVGGGDRIWVRVEAAIAALTQGVFVRHTCAAPVLPNTCKGQFAPSLVDNDSGVEAAQTFTLTVATATYTGLAVTVILTNAVTGKSYSLSYAAPDAATDDQDDVAGDLAALIDALDGIGATATGAVVTCTAGTIGDYWKVYCDARVTVAQTNDSDYVVWERARWVAAKTEGAVNYGLLEIKEN